MTRSFQRFAAYSAIVAAATSLVFTASFAVVVRDGDRWAQWVQLDHVVHRAASSRFR